MPFIASAAITLLAILAHTGFASDGAEEKGCRRRAATATGRTRSPAGRLPRRCAPSSLGARVAARRRDDRARRASSPSSPHHVRALAPRGRGGSTQLLPLDARHGAALRFGAPLYDRLRRGRPRRDVAARRVLRLQFVTVATWAALERHGQVGRAGLGALLVLTGLFNALPFHLPGPVAMIQRGGPEHAATIPLVDALIIVSGLVIKAGLIDGVEKASRGGSGSRPR